MYIVRHALTVNSGLRHTGWTDLPLSPEGVNQAQTLKEFFAGKSHLPIYSSDLRRAVDTVRLATSREPIQLAGLRERNWGTETTEQFNSRVIATLAQIPSEAIVVTHGATARLIIAYLTHHKPSEVPALRNCEVRSVSLKNPEPVLFP